MRRNSLEPGLGASLGAFAAFGTGLVLVPFRNSIDNSSVALLLVIPVLFGAVLGGWQGGVITALIATLSFDFLLTRPYNSLTIDSADDGVAAVLLMVVGVVVGVVAGQAPPPLLPHRTGHGVPVPTSDRCVTEHIPDEFDVSGA